MHELHKNPSEREYEVNRELRWSERLPLLHLRLLILLHSTNYYYPLCIVIYAHFTFAFRLHAKPRNNTSEQFVRFISVLAQVLASIKSFDVD